MTRKILFIFVVLSLLLISNQVSAKIDSKYFIETITDRNGDQVDKIIVPGTPPENFRAPIALPSRTAVILSNVPAFDWSYGCSATSAAMMAGYYDNTGYGDMYTGSINGGVCPMTNIVTGWGSGECTLSATHQGYDGLTTRGHVDDYWVEANSSSPDPYIGNWSAHRNADCTADYMGTNQSTLGNIDGATTFYFATDGSPQVDYSACEPSEKDGCHGLRQFFESRGYTVTNNYSQYIAEQGLTYGFSFEQYMAEIDAGRPVLIQVEGHTMLGYGYDVNGNYVYLHDTWDNSSHTMTWGGSYSGMNHYGVGVFELEAISGTPTAPSTPDPADSATDVSISTMISWTNGSFTDDVDVYFSDNQSLVTNKDDSALIYSSTAVTSLDPSVASDLSYSTQYYWRVVCKNSSRASTDGPVWTFTTEDLPGIEATLSYYPDISYYISVPDGNGITKFGVYYTPADACDLTKIKAYFYGTEGSPTSCELKFYSALDDGSGLEYPNTLLHTENVPIASIPAGWSEPEFILSSPLHFNAGENFFIIYEITGLNPTDTVNLLRSHGSTSGGEGTHTICEYSGSWYYHSNLWSSPFEIAMDATVEYAAAIPPNFAISPSSVDFLQTAIGGWKTETITLRNDGGGQVVVNSVALSGDTQILLYDYNTYPDTLLSNESISVMVAYGPDDEVTNNATLTISETSTTRTEHDVDITGQGYYHNSWAAGTPMFDQPPAGNQGDNPWSMSTSDLAPNYLHAENFWGLTEPIQAIEFWGINWYYDNGWEESDAEDPMTFDIKFYTDHASAYSPDTEFASYTLTLNRTITDTTFSSGPVYRYLADLPTEVALTEGWISIQATTVSSPDDPWFLWSTSPIGDHANVNYNYSSSEWEYADNDLAFAIYGALQPPVNVEINISGTNAIITWDSEPGLDYNVYCDTDPSGNFTTLLGTVTDGSGSYTDVPETDAKKFYRVTASFTTRDNHIHQILPTLTNTRIIRAFDSPMEMNRKILKK